MSTINSYMSEIEKELYLFDTDCKIESNKISLMIEAVDNKLETNYLLAEKKVMLENGSYEDLTYYYTEANEEAKGDREGVFTRIKNFFIKIKNGIVNFFKKIFGKEDMEGDAPQEFEKAFSILDSVKGFFNQQVSLFKSGQYGALVVTSVAAGFSILGEIKSIESTLEWTAKSAKKLKHYTKEAVTKWKKKIHDGMLKMCKDLEDIINKAAADGNVPAQWCQKLMDLLNQAKSRAINVWTNFTAWLTHKKTDDDNDEQKKLESGNKAKGLLAAGSDEKSNEEDQDNKSDDKELANKSGNTQLTNIKSNNSDKQQNDDSFNNDVPKKSVKSLPAPKKLPKLNEGDYSRLKDLAQIEQTIYKGCGPIIPFIPQRYSGEFKKLNNIKDEPNRSKAFIAWIDSITSHDHEISQYANDLMKDNHSKDDLSTLDAWMTKWFVWLGEGKRTLENAKKSAQDYGQVKKESTDDLIYDLIDIFKEF